MACPSRESEPPHTTADDTSAFTAQLASGRGARRRRRAQRAELREQERRTLTWQERLRRARRGRQYTTGEEIGNAVSHGVGALLAIAALVILVVVAVRDGGGLRLLAAIAFGVTLVLEYLFSTLYHAIQPPAAKGVLRIFDHCSIYLLIAGTYTPFTLVTLWGQGGLALNVVIWAAAILGIVIETLSRERQPKWVSALIYLVMGWAVIVRMPALVAALPVGGLALLVAGGVSYTVGVLFYLLKKVPYAHMVWHLFVLGGSVCHVLAVILFVL